MAIQSTEVLPDNTLEEFRIEFNKLITDVSGLSLGNTFSTQIIFEGDTDDTFETGISVTDPTADRSIIFPDQSGNVLLDSANINLVDNIQLQFGTGSDLKIYHDGSHSYIDDAGTGSLLIRSNQIELKKQSSDEKMATFAEDGAITLYHNNVEILATAATGISVAGDVTATDDLNLTSDAAVLSFGENSEVTLTHVHNDGLLLNADNQLQFRDNAINIRSPADGDLDINADDEIELNSTLIDINGNVEISGTLAQVGVATFTARDIHSGGITIANDGTIGSVGDADAIAISSAGVVTFSQTPVFSGDSTFSDDISLTSDGAIINFGVNSEVTLTHVHDDGLLLNSDNQLQFRDAAIHISSTADGDLSIAADDEIDITSTLIDINGNVDISGTTLMTGVATHGGNVISDTDSTDDLGTTGVRWANLFVDAITATDQITATGFTGTLDGILGSGAAAAATTTTLASTTITASGIIKTDDTTAATTTTDGSLQTDGGLSVAGAAIIGADISILSTVTSDNGDLGEINFHNTTNAGSGSGTSFVHQVAAIQGKMEGTGNNSGGSLHFITKADGGSRTEVMSLDAGGDLALLTDAAVLSFGVNSEVTLTHVHDVGLTLKHTATADDKPIVLTLATGETDMAANDVMGKIQFQAPDEGTGTDAILVAAAIQAVSEGDFSSSANATRLEFMTGASEAAATKMTLTSAGNVGIGSAETSLFNGAGTSAKLVVTGSNSNTNIVQNGVAAIAIVNTDQTDENTAGLHFARADTDDTPNYAGASIVAQFKETQATGQYPSATLSFLTSSSQNAAPTVKMTLTEAGNVGIGTSTPLAKLDVRSASTAAAAFSTIGNSDNSVYVALNSGHSGDNPAFTWRSGKDLRVATTTVADGTGYAEKLRITSAGLVGIGTAAPLSKNHTLGAGTAVVASGSDGRQEAIIEGANIALTSSFGNLNIISNTAQAADTGGQIAFGGKSTDSDNKYATWAVIKGAKENATSANIASYLAFSTRANGAGNTEKMRITSDGRGLSQFTAKAWINFNGAGTVAIRDSHNITSITDNGTGDYTVTIAVDMGSANYAITATTRQESANLGGTGYPVGGQSGVLVGSYRMLYYNSATDGSARDHEFVTNVVFGD